MIRRMPAMRMNPTRKSMMMTMQEVKEEYKEREGNPLVKSRIKSLQREMSRRRM